MTDPAHQEQFVQQLIAAQDRLYAYARSLLHDPAAAEDAVQQANLVLWRKADTFQPGTEFGAWACRIAYYEILKIRQRHARDKLVFDDDLLSVLAEESERRSALADARRRALHDCLAKLPDEHRALIEARYEDGASVQRLAEQHDRPVKTVYQMLYRIRATLTDCVRRALAADPDA